MTSEQDPRPVPLGLAPSFGFGDRIGCATPGHVASMKQTGAGIEPIFPQQSIREMMRTSRSATEVMNDALSGMKKAGWNGKTGADADHLKTTEDVDITFAAGFTFFTIDPSEHVDSKADDYDQLSLRNNFDSVAERVAWRDDYVGRQIKLPTGTRVDLTEEACMRAAVKYGLALNEALMIADYIRQIHQHAGRDYEIELSVDETEQPTTLAEHFIIADQCLQRGMKLVSLAPRFMGDFEKGVDYKGNIEQLEGSLTDHNAIAEMLGPYKLSLHSGSDKLSMYTALARATKGRFHVKTAGTSYLEALRVAARHDAHLFREIIDFSRDHFETDRATYHLSATLDSVPPASEISNDRTLEKLYLELWADVPERKGFTYPGRQILHCTFGSVLTHKQLGARLRDVLTTHSDTYTAVLKDHFDRHLRALQAGM